MEGLGENVTLVNCLPKSYRTTLVSVNCFATRRVVASTDRLSGADLRASDDVNGWAEPRRLGGEQQ